MRIKDEGKYEWRKEQYAEAAEQLAEHEVKGDRHGDGGLDRVNVIAVTPDGLQVLEDGEDIPLAEFIDHKRERTRRGGPL